MNKLKTCIIKRNSSFHKWVKDHTEKNRHAVQKPWNDIKKLIRNAKREQMFKELGNNPSAQIVYQNLKYKNV